ncbi:MAG TPA: anti-sigma factor [Acidimicrobiia bacterium]|nr:anti-sigma factor [Acidimicrobiia bacterium]
MNCAAVLESVALDRWEDQTAVTSHLAVCPQCRMRVASSEALGRHLRDPLIWEEPPDELADRVVATVAGEAVAKDRRPRWWVFGVAAALALVVAIGLTMSNQPDWTVALAPAPQAPGAAATVSGWNMEHGTKMMVEVSGLEHSGSDAYYEMWLTAPDGRHVSAGTFRMSGRFEMMAGVRRTDYPRLWITLEPADNDPSPYPHMVLDMAEA